MGQDLTACLHQYYELQGIAVNNFRCPHSGKCESAAAPELLTGRGSEAHVGSQYGNPVRIVIVSLDRGEGAEDVWKRSASIEGLPAHGKGLNPHMSGTLATLKAILGERGGPTLWSRFAMINAAKCCYGNMDAVPDSLYRACSEFGLQELIRLKPQIVVTQGRNAKEPVRLRQYSISQRARDIAERYLSGCTKPELRDAVEWMIERYIHQIDLGESKCLWLETPHPSDRAGRWHPFRCVFLPVLGGVMQELLASGLS
jgi:hypothetical protein